MTGSYYLATRVCLELIVCLPQLPKGPELWECTSIPTSGQWTPLDNLLDKKKSSAMNLFLFIMILCTQSWDQLLVGMI